MKDFKYGWVVCLSFILVGCNTIMLKSASGTDEANAKSFSPDPTRALIYVFRDDSFLGRDLASQMVINNISVTKNEHNQFNVVSVTPGKYDLFSLSLHETSKLTSLLHNSGKARVSLTVESGKLYFVQEIFKPTTGFYPKVVSAEAAAPIIKKAKFVAQMSLQNPKQ